MKKLIIIFLLFQITNFCFGAKKEKEKGVLTKDKEDIILSVKKEQFKITCPIQHHLAALALGNSSISIAQNRNVSIDKKNYVEIIQQFIPQFLQNIYDIGSLIKITPDTLSQPTLPAVSMNKTGSLKTGWPTSITGGHIIEHGFTILADGKPYYICETLNQQIENQMQQALEKNQPFVLCLRPLDNSNQLLNLLINEFSVKTNQPKNENSFSFDQLPMVDDEDDYFNFGEPITHPNGQKKTTRESENVMPKWQKTLLIGIPLAAFALIFALWKQGLLKISA